MIIGKLFLFLYVELLPKFDRNFQLHAVYQNMDYKCSLYSY
jgi:hypothetical protein